MSAEDPTAALRAFLQAPLPPPPDGELEETAGASDFGELPPCKGCGRRLDPPDPTRDPCDLCELIGQRLGHCRVQRLIGRGGMGAVYLAEHLALERPVAIKTLASRARADPQAVVRFMREARLASTVRHPNLAQVYDVGDERGHSFLVMELVEGVDLARMVEEAGPLAPERASRYLAGVAEALAAAHAAGVVHRDVKPANLVLTHAGQIKLIDFGLARRVELDPGGGLTSVGQVLGTPHYMAPEQARGDAVDGRADVYSLGMSLHALLSGQAPFAGDAPIDVLMKQLDQQPTPIESLRDDVPVGLRSLLDAMIRKRPDERPGAGEVARRLRAGFADEPEPTAGEGDRATPAEPAPRPASSRRRASNRRVASRVTTRRVKRRLRPAQQAAPALGLAAAAAALALLVIAASGRGRRPASTPLASAPSSARAEPRSTAPAPAPSSVSSASATTSAAPPPSSATAPRSPQPPQPSSQPLPASSTTSAPAASTDASSSSPPTASSEPSPPPPDPSAALRARIATARAAGQRAAERTALRELLALESDDHSARKRLVELLPATSRKAIRAHLELLISDGPYQRWARFERGRQRIAARDFGGDDDVLAALPEDPSVEQRLQVASLIGRRRPLEAARLLGCEAVASSKRAAAARALLKQLSAPLTLQIELPELVERRPILRAQLLAAAPTCPSWQLAEGAAQASSDPKRALARLDWALKRLQGARYAEQRRRHAGFGYLHRMRLHRRAELWAETLADAAALCRSRRLPWALGAGIKPDAQVIEAVRCRLEAQLQLERGGPATVSWQATGLLGGAPEPGQLQRLTALLGQPPEQPLLGRFGAQYRPSLVLTRSQHPRLPVGSRIVAYVAEQAPGDSRLSDWPLGSWGQFATLLRALERGDRAQLTLKLGKGRAVRPVVIEGGSPLGLAGWVELDPDPR